MSTLIPAHAAGNIREGLTEYLTTSFSLADAETSTELERFLTDADGGMFHGPYVRSRLPYAQATDWENVLGWLPDWFVPYHHQDQAFRRLRSVNENGPRRPEPTLVVTGTGSGKTEAFLMPILDHARRMRARGQTGVKALLLYPMNALANDQAERLVTLLNEESALSGVTAGIYTGEAKGQATKVSPTSLINNQEVMQQDPPDILLTNYKMLDQLLLRPRDREIWERSAESLTYLVLDEFHSYDGAQGTDVALLLRRLGLMLKRHQSPGFLDAADATRPLGQVTPVATSATLGSGRDTTEIRDFARTIFGEEFSPEAVVTEHTLALGHWQREIAASFGPPTLSDDQHTIPDVEDVAELLEHLATAPAGIDHAEHVYTVFCERVWHCPTDTRQAVRNYAAHPLTELILEHAATPVPLNRRVQDEVDTLPELVLGETMVRQLGQERSAELITHALTAMAYLRANLDVASWARKRLPGIETHLWVRELSRIDRAVTDVGPEAGSIFRWSDDGQSDDVDESAVVWLPACFCRACGRSGWMTALEPGTETPETEPSVIRRASIENRGRQRPLLDATAEQRAALSAGRPVAGPRGGDADSAVLWLHTDTRELSVREPTEAEAASGSSIPVLTHYGLDADDLADEQTCPSCGTTDSIRYIGSSIATLLSVSLSNLFGMSDLDTSEKKTLVFTDSVQDAAHRAGFVQSRSRAFALRTLTRRAVTEDGMTLARVPDRLMELAAGNARSRYELLPPDLTDYPQFRGYWDKDASDGERRQAGRHVRRRLGLDLALEFGQRADLARSLSLTGSLTVEVEVGDELARSAADDALGAVTAPSLDSGDASRRLAWVRGVLEMTRERGGIYHHWFEPYLKDDGNAYLLNRRQARAQGIPGFPPGGSPEFPRLGQALSNARRDSGVTPLGSPRGRFARWTARQLGLSTHDAATAVAQLFRELAKREVLMTVDTNSGGTIFALSPEQIRVSCEDDPALLECDVCRARTGVAAEVRQVLSDSPCFTPSCAGTLRSEPIDDNYYRTLYSSEQPRTVVAREHTSLLDTPTRVQRENAFRSGDESADSPNVLVATPTLEMGIDIGDLSTVMLASLPTSVASYVQRVGRAGRLTGNSLILALVKGRGATLPKLNKPLSVISGAVSPPVAFLAAVEILNRQFTAYLVDSIDLAMEIPDLSDAVSVFNDVPGEPALVDVITRRVRAGIDDLLTEFITTLTGQITEDSAAELRRWATTEEAGGLIARLAQSRNLWRSERAELTARRERLYDRRDELDKRSDEGDSELAEEKRGVRASLRHVNQQLSETVNGQHWVAAMERFGLLPNFTLIDDSVELSVAVSHLNTETMEFETVPFEYSRGVSLALFELAPGATFYAQGIAATIDSVEIGHQGAAIEQWRLCPDCSHSQILIPDAPQSISCPQCGSPTWADKGQVLDVVQLRKVSAEVEKTRHTITDTRDDRYISRFHSAVSYTVPEHGRGRSWYLSEGFGVEHLRQVELRWLNLGKGNGEKRLISGRELTSPLFSVCRHCGHLDSEIGDNNRRDHRPWCTHRTAREEDTVSFALGRTLRTEGVLMLLPELFTSEADRLTVTSLIAAIKLGFKEVLGGDPDHLDVLTVQVPRSTGGSVDALMLHDTVPGGTGYLTQFTEPEQVRALLLGAWERVSACSCADDDRLACPDCLLPYARGRDIETTSRAAAERALAALLLNENHPEPDADPRQAGWDVQTQRAEPSESSQLELRFRILIRKALKDRNAEITDKIVAGRPVLEFTLPGGRRWRLEEQRVFPHTTPDLYLEPINGPHRPVAIYLDGAAYHISPAAFRVHGDVRKRAGLAADSIIPWSLTSADLDRYEQRADTAPAWTTEVGNQLASANPVLDPLTLELLTSPVQLLLAYLTEPEKKAWEELAHAAAAHAITHETSREGDLILGRIFGRITLTASMSVGQVRARHLTLDAADADDLSRDTWNTFLTLTNLMWLSPDQLTVTSGTGVQTSAIVESVVEKQVAEDAVGTEIPAGWQEIFAEYEDESDVERALNLLVDAGARPTDVIGEEYANSVGVIAWPAQQVVLLFDSEADAAATEELQSQGWTVLHADTLTAETVPAELIEES
ncbi:DEAD/DEAH box helicase [Corynebacterium efficiens YS-314]|uniref:Helicase n=1 Tax=Corynebacterium efficiens (strain DSM 44549 / YS-314 / AJ 12310 / JCM 11189 / NBRC 100395) TaxID=196164 RepID=Q8FSZ7_COREF|nr:DEAD/DEAH box helicase [Corynebacterium efficiens]EEW48589.1 DEAD/DEAH box helicase [Corynebacterium efficiens YS-314]BAC19705.1 conserved hypothetical protein [Corynebacterium efficiens YS-314]